jgi:hypothetical protein
MAPETDKYGSNFEFRIETEGIERIGLERQRRRQ